MKGAAGSVPISSVASVPPLRVVVVLIQDVPDHRLPEVHVPIVIEVVACDLLGVVDESSISVPVVPVLIISSISVHYIIPGEEPRNGCPKGGRHEACVRKRKREDASPMRSTRVSGGGEFTGMIVCLIILFRNYF